MGLTPLERTTPTMFERESIFSVLAGAGAYFLLYVGVTWLMLEVSSVDADGYREWPVWWDSVSPITYQATPLMAGVVAGVLAVAHPLRNGLIAGAVGSVLAEPVVVQLVHRESLPWEDLVKEIGYGAYPSMCIAVAVSAWAGAALGHYLKQSLRSNTAAKLGRNP